MPITVPSTPYDIPSANLSGVTESNSMASDDKFLAVIAGDVRRVLRANTGVAKVHRGGGSPTFNPATNDIWIDTNTSPATFKVYDGTSWVTESLATSGLADNSVTNGKLNEMAGNTVKVNANPTSDNPQDVNVSANQFIARGSSGNLQAKVVEDEALSLLTQSTVSGMRTFLGLGSIAVESASDFLEVSNNLSEITATSNARTNLGLGTAATEDTVSLLQSSNDLSDLNDDETARENLGAEGNLALAKLIGADFNTTSDQTIDMPSGQYVIDSVVFINASSTPANATGGVYTQSSKSGVAVVPSTQAYSGLTSADKFVDPSLDAATDDTSFNSNLFLSLSTAEGSVLTCDVYVYGRRIQ